MKQVTVLAQRETALLDRDRMRVLLHQLGESGAEDVMCRAMEQLAIRLSHAQRMFVDRDNDGMRKCVKSLVAISDQMGMKMLVQVAHDVIACIDQGNDVGLHATQARLMRVAESSMTEAWDIQDLAF